MSWPVSRLDRLADAVLGKMLDKQKNRGTPRPYLRNINVRWGSFDLSDVQKMPFEDHEEARYSVQLGDVVVCEGGEPGRCAVWPHEKTFFIQKAVHRVRCSEQLVPTFLAYWIRHLAASGQLAKLSTGTTIQHLPGVALAALEVPHPPTDEQHRVVAAIETHFSRLEAAVASLTRAKANVKRARASVLKAAVEGRLVPTEAALARAEGRDYEPASTLLARILVERQAAWTASGAKGKYMDPVAPETAAAPDLPEGWVYCRIDTAGKVHLGRQRSPKNHQGPNMRPYLRVANVFEARIDLSDVMEMNFTPEEFEAFKLSAGDILLNEGQSPHLVGRPAMWNNERPDMCFTNSLVRFQAANGVLPSFALMVFRAQLAARRYMKLVTITTNIAHLGAQRFAAVEFPLAPLAEQHRVVAEVDRRLSVLDALDDTLDANLARCKRLRQSILKQAFEGKLVPAEEPHGHTTSKACAPQLPLFEGAAG